MFGRTNKKISELQVKCTQLELEIEKLKVRLDGLDTNVRSTRGLVNRKMKNTLEEEESPQENPVDMQEMQRRLLFGQPQD